MFCYYPYFYFKIINMNKLVLILSGIFISVAVIYHFLKIIYLLFEPKFLAKLKSISTVPTKGWLLIYYVITIAFLIQAFLFKV